MAFKSSFGDWFSKQYGPRPGGNKSDATLRDSVTKARYVLRKAERLLELRDSWEDARTVALRAWNARGLS